MILFRKFKLPRLIFRTWPWKIAMYVAVPLLTLTSISLATYFIIDYNNKTNIKTEFSINNLSNVNSLSQKEVPQLNEDDLRDILIEQFNVNQTYPIATPKNAILISIDSLLTSAVNGTITFNATFSLTNNTNVNQKFTISGFKAQARPNKLANNITIDNDIFANIYPTSLADVNNTSILDTNNQNYSKLKESIFNLLPNKPENLSINDFFIEADSIINSNYDAFNSWNGSIIIRYYLDKTKYKYPEFSYSTTVFGFKKYDLLNLQPIDGAIKISAPLSYSTAIASNIDNNKIKEIIIDELIQNDTTIPLKPEDINIEINRSDNKNGNIYLKYLQITTYNPIKNYSNVIINGFKKVVPTLKTQIISNHKYQSLLANEIDSIKLKEIVYDNLIIPSSIQILPNDIIVDVVQIDAINGSLKLIPNIRGYETNPFITGTTNGEITITNFKVNRPKPLNSEYTIPNDYAMFKPSELDDEVYKK